MYNIKVRKEKQTSEEREAVESTRKTMKNRQSLSKSEAAVDCRIPLQITAEKTNCGRARTTKISRRRLEMIGYHRIEWL